MKAVLFCDVRTTRFFLTGEDLASDDPDRAREFRDGADAEGDPPRVRRDWGRFPGFDWRPGYLFSDGQVA